MRRTLLLATAVIFSANVAQAHVTVSPRDSRPAAQETYSFNVPTEGASATTAVELEVPTEVSLVSVDAPQESYELARENGRVVRVRWRVDVPPGEARRLSLVARNPAAGSEIAWKVHQLFADGTRRDWVEAPGSRQPAPRTRLVPAQ